MKNPAVDAMLAADEGAKTLEELRDACRALDRIVMFEHYQVPATLRAVVLRIVLEQFGIPRLRPSTTRSTSRATGRYGRSTAWWSKDAEGDQVAKAAARSPMLIYVLKRILLMIPTLLGALTVTFVVIQFVPGGPVEQMVAELRAASAARARCGGARGRRDLDAKQIEEIKKLYGFDKPPLTRYVEMLKNFARFDLGRSFMHNKDVWQLIKEKLPVSISLGLWTFLLTYLISIPLGVAKAVREGSRFDAVDHAARARRLRAPGLRARRAPDRAVRGRHVPRLVPAARAHVRQLGDAVAGPRSITDYLWHLVLPLTCYAIGSFADDHDAHQEHVRRGNPQAVRAGRARQGRVRAARAVQARVPQRADPDRHRLSRRRSWPRSSPARC